MPWCASARTMRECDPPVPRRQKVSARPRRFAARGSSSAESARDILVRGPRDSSPPRRVAMATYSLTHLSDGALLRDMAALVAQDRTTTAALLAHLAEVDARKLYLPAAYPSMFAYCVGELRLSEEAAFKR